MSFFQKFWLGLRSYSGAVDFIRQHNLWKYLLVPAVINLLVFVGIGVGVWEGSAKLGERLLDWWNVTEMAGFWGGALQWTIRIVVKVLAFLLYLKLFRYIILIVSAPGLALLAEKTQEILTGIHPPFSFSQLLKDTVRGMGISLKNLLLELALTIPLYFLAFIPVLTPFVAVAVLGIESYFVGFSTMDYRNEFHRLSARESRRLIRRHRGAAIGNGILFNLLLPIPFIGVLLMPPLSVVAAALAAEQLEGIGNEFRSV